MIAVARVVVTDRRRQTNSMLHLPPPVLEAGEGLVGPDVLRVPTLHRHALNVPSVTHVARRLT